MAKKGRKIKYNKTLVKKVCKYFAEGLSAHDSVIRAGLGESTFYDWCREFEADGSPNPSYHADFVEAIKEADVKRKQTLLKQIGKDKSWQSKAWYLERIYKNEFSTRQEKQLQGEARIQIEVVPFVPSNADPKLLQRLKEAYGEKAIDGETPQPLIPAHIVDK